MRDSGPANNAPPKKKRGFKGGGHVAASKKTGVGVGASGSSGPSTPKAKPTQVANPAPKTSRAAITAPGAAFGPGPGSGPALQPQRRAQNRPVRKAEARLPKASDVPRLPVLQSYSKAQKQEITKRFVDYVHAKQKQGHTPDEIIGGRNLQAPEVRDFLHKVYGVSTTASRKFEREHGPANTDQVKPGRAPAKGMAFKGTTKIGGVVPVPGLHQLGFTVSGALHELQRPSSFVTGAANAARNGEPILKGAAENFKTQKISGSDLLRDSGSGKTVAALGGEGFDLLTNPLNLVGAGVAAPAAKLTAEASRYSNIARGLREAGNIEKATVYEAKAAKAADKATKLPANRGTHLTFGTANHNISTSGATSARIYGGLRVPQVAKGVRDTTPYQVVATRLHAGFRPAGVSEREWNDFRNAQRLGAGETEAGRTYWNRAGRAVERALKGDGDAHAVIRDALEHAPKPTRAPAPGELPPLPHGDRMSLADLGDAHHREIGAHLERVLAGFGKSEQDAGLLGPDSLREGYLTHILTPQARKSYKKFAGGKGGRNPYSNQRTIDGTISEINAQAIADGLHPKFVESLGTILSERGGKNATLLAHKKMQNTVVDQVARPFTSLDDLRGVDSVYVSSPSGLRAVSTKRNIPDEHDIVKARQNLGHGEKLVVMPRVIGEPTIRGPLAHSSVQLSEREIKDLSAGFDRIMGKVKSGLTVLNAPAYQMRNLAGDIFNSRLAGTTIRDLKDGSKLIEQRGARNRSQAKVLEGSHVPKGTVDIGHGRTMTREQLIRDMEDRRVIGSGFNGFDLQEFSGEVSGQFGQRVHGRMVHGFREGGVKGAIKNRPRPVQGLRDAGQYPEDAVRASTYLGALRKGMSPDEAATWTAKHHFDYADLTNYERKILKRLFPFWTFTARNTPLQASKFLQKPGVYSNYGLTMEEGRKQAGLPEDYQTRLPGYQQNQLSIPLNVHGSRILASPQLPLTDLQRPAAALRGDPLEVFKQTIQMVNPLAKLIGEPALNYSAFFRGPIYQDADHPDAPHYVPAPAYIRELDKALPGIAAMFAGGSQEAADKGMWTAKADYFARMFPQSNAATQALTEKPGSRSQSNTGALVSQLTGVKINNYTPEKYRLNKLYADRDKISAKVNDARTLGKPAEVKRLNKKKYALQDEINKARDKAGLPVTKTKRKKSGGFGPSSGSGGKSGYGPR